MLGSPCGTTILKVLSNLSETYLAIDSAILEGKCFTSTLISNITKLLIVMTCNSVGVKITRLEFFAVLILESYHSAHSDDN